MGKKSKKKRQTVLTPSMVEFLDQHVSALNCSQRTTNMLEVNKLRTVSELLHCCPEKSDECKRGPFGLPCENRHILNITNLGDSTLAEIFARLEEFGFWRY